MTPDSGIDLLVLKKVDTDVWKHRVGIRRQFTFDVIVMNPRLFEQAKNLKGDLAYPASKHGRGIYDAV